VNVGRIATATLVVVGCLWAPIVGSAGSVFTYIQMFWGFISPGIVAAFLFGLFSTRTPPSAAIGAMLLGVPIYGLLLWSLPDVAFLHHMMITFIVLAIYMAVLRFARPLDAPRTLPVSRINLETAPFAGWIGAGIVVATALLYVVFW
jgi:SSS family solute:Na+ symporter